MSDQPLSLTEILAATPVPPGTSPFPCQIGVYCDNCGLLELHDYVVHSGMTRDERLDAARKYLTEHMGWDCGAAGDLCPDCKADEPGMCPACDTAAIERCEACGRCRCDTHESCTRPASV